MKHLLLSIVLASFSLIGLSQTPSELKAETIDSLVLWVSQNIQSPPKDSTLVYRNAHKGVKLSENANNKVQLAASYRNLATWHLGAKTIDSTTFYLFLAESIYKELNSEKSLSETYVELENAFKQRADYTEAMIYSFKSLALNEKSDDQRAIANSYTRLCDLLYYQDKNDEGANYCQKTIDILKELNHPQDVGRVILNLITNAFYVINEKKKQQREGYEPTVTVNTEKKGNLALVSVKDNGNGIPKKVMDKIFQPFFTTKPTGEGTGSELSLSYDIIKAQGGETKVKTKEGEGSEFIIELPLN